MVKKSRLWSARFDMDVGRFAALRAETLALIKLGAPTMMTRIGLVAMITVDLVMIGDVSTIAQASYGVAMPIAITAMLMGIGLTVAVAVLTAQARGAGENQRCGGIWRAGMLVALISGVGLGGVLIEGNFLIQIIDPAAELRSGALTALRALGFGIPGILLYSCSALFLEGLGRPAAALVIIIIGNITNVTLNYMVTLVDVMDVGDGALIALATSVTRWLMAIIAFICVCWLPDRENLGLGGRSRGFFIDFVAARRMVGKIFRVGIPMMIALMVESMAFTSVAVMAGRLGAEAAAAYHILFNLLAILFMLAIGLSTAAAVRVGNAVGRLDAKGVQLSGWLALGLVITLMIVAGGSLVLFRHSFTSFYTSDPRVLALALPLVWLVALALTFDGMQGVMMGSLRGAGDVLIPTGLQFIAFWGFMVTIAWQFGSWGGIWVIGADRRNDSRGSDSGDAVGNPILVRVSA